MTDHPESPLPPTSSESTPSWSASAAPGGGSLPPLPVDPREPTEAPVLERDFAPRRWRGIALTLAVALVLSASAWILGFATGLHLTPSAPPAPANVQPPENFKLYGEAWSYVEREFYGTSPQPEAVTAHAIDGLVDALEDPHTLYLDAERASETDADFLPALAADIGAWIEPVANGALVVAVIPGSPVDNVLRAGDTLVGVGEDELANHGRAEALAHLAGTPGSSVDLFVLHASGGGQAVKIERRTTPHPVIALDRPEPGIARLALGHMGPNAVDELDAALGGLDGDTDTALIIDLRNNPGGDEATLAAIAGRFVSGTVWVEAGQDGTSVPHEADTSGAPVIKLPARIVVVANDGTAGTAEMLAAALRDDLGAPLIGSRTFGKTGIQRTTTLSDQTRMRLTVAHWRTPKGHLATADGLKPDREVDRVVADAAAGADGAAGADADSSAGAGSPTAGTGPGGDGEAIGPLVEGASPADAEGDPQLDAAIDEARSAARANTGASRG